jgi:hypothetical protein
MDTTGTTSSWQMRHMRVGQVHSEVDVVLSDGGASSAGPMLLVWVDDGSLESEGLGSESAGMLSVGSLIFNSYSWPEE